MEGIWAAGEVVGGIKGRDGPGISSVLESIVFGHVAGVQCAEYVQSENWFEYKKDIKDRYNARQQADKPPALGFPPGNSAWGPSPYNHY